MRIAILAAVVACFAGMANAGTVGYELLFDAGWNEKRVGTDQRIGGTRGNPIMVLRNLSSEAKITGLTLSIASPAYTFDQLTREDHLAGRITSFLTYIFGAQGYREVDYSTVGVSGPDAQDGGLKSPVLDLAFQDLAPGKLGGAVIDLDGSGSGPRQKFAPFFDSVFSDGGYGVQVSFDNGQVLTQRIQRTMINSWAYQSELSNNGTFYKTAQNAVAQNQPSPVPLPATAPLFMVAVAAFGALARRRQSRAA